MEFKLGLSVWSKFRNQANKEVRGLCTTQGRVLCLLKNEAEHSWLQLQPQPKALVVSRAVSPSWREPPLVSVTHQINDWFPTHLSIILSTWSAVKLCRRQSKSEKFSGLSLTAFCLVCSGPGICPALSAQMNCLETNWSDCALHQDWHFYGAWKTEFQNSTIWKMVLVSGRAIPCSVSEEGCGVLLRKEQITWTKRVRLRLRDLGSLVPSLLINSLRWGYALKSGPAFEPVFGWRLSLIHKLPQTAAPVFISE